MFNSLVFIMYLVVSPPPPSDIQTYRGGIRVCLVTPPTSTCQTYISDLLFPTRDACETATREAAREYVERNNRRPDLVVQTACVTQSLQEYRLETRGVDV